MKQEEMNDISTILVEATDERAAVMQQVSKQTRPVVIVLPEQADQIFRQPGDFFELKRLKRERGLSITLVISGHERIRNMARRQGFQVYTSAETCARALARRDRLYTMRGISLSGTTSLTDKVHFIAQGDEDETPPWSYDVRMQQAITQADNNLAQESEPDDTPWSYDIAMQQDARLAETPATLRMQSQNQSDDDTPWSYDVYMEQGEQPATEYSRHTAWTQAKEDLWKQQYHLPARHNQYTSSTYLERAPLAGAPHQPEMPAPAQPTVTEFSYQGKQASDRTADTSNWSLRAGSEHLKETPIPPSFTETLENLVALSGVKPGSPSYLQQVSSTGHTDAMLRPISVYNSSLSGSRHLIRPVDETPTQPVLAIRAQVAYSAPNTEPLYPAIATRPLVHNEYAGSRLALMLTALLILGILGGVCCGYVLTLMHVHLTVFNTWSQLAGISLSYPWV